MEEKEITFKEYHDALETLKRFWWLTEYANEYRLLQSGEQDRVFDFLKKVVKESPEELVADSLKKDSDFMNRFNKMASVVFQTVAGGDKPFYEVARYGHSWDEVPTPGFVDELWEKTVAVLTPQISGLLGDAVSFFRKGNMPQDAYAVLFPDLYPNGLLFLDKEHAEAFCSQPEYVKKELVSYDQLIQKIQEKRMYFELYPLPTPHQQETSKKDDSDADTLEERIAFYDSMKRIWYQCEYAKNAGGRVREDAEEVQEKLKAMEPLSYEEAKAQVAADDTFCMQYRQYRVNHETSQLGIYCLGILGLEEIGIEYFVDAGYGHYWNEVPLPDFLQTMFIREMQTFVEKEPESGCLGMEDNLDQKEIPDGAGAISYYDMSGLALVFVDFSKAEAFADRHPVDPSDFMEYHNGAWYGI